MSRALEQHCAVGGQQHGAGDAYLMLQRAPPQPEMYNTVAEPWLAVTGCQPALAEQNCAFTETLCPAVPCLQPHGCIQGPFGRTGYCALAHCLAQHTHHLLLLSLLQKLRLIAQPMPVLKSHSYYSCCCHDCHAVLLLLLLVDIPS